MRLLASALLAAALAAATPAQTSFPMITHVTPVAVQRGRTAEVTVEGQMDFRGAYAVLVRGRGVTAEVQEVPSPKPPVRSVKLKVTVAADAPLGVREFRIVTSLGLSSLGQLLVVDEPVVSESGANNTQVQANPVSVPCVACGRIEAAEDVDWFKFPAKAGQVLTFEVFGARIEDKIHDLQKHLDPLIAVYDADGRELAANDDALFADPLLTFPVPRDGTYFVQIRDAKYDGDPRWVYALRITDRPFASHVYPVAGGPDQSTTLEPVGSAAKVQAKVPFRFPKEVGLHEVQLDAAGRTTNPVTVYVSPLPVVNETEPNDDPAKANPIKWPCAINGRIGSKRDADCFAFAAKKGEPLRFEVKARRFGTVLRSGLDAVMEVLTPKGAVLASGDDEIGKDPVVVFNPPADGEYVVRIRDLNSKGGDSFVYVLEADRAAPDFSLRVDSGKAMIGPGSATAWYVAVTRTNGFTGPVTVAVEGLPAGMTASALTIPATMTQGLLVLSADPMAKRGASMVRVVGRAGNLERTATVSEEIYLPGGGRGRMEAEMAAAAVTDPSDILRVEVTPKTVSLKPGEEVRLDVTIERRKDYDKSVSLDVQLRHLGTVYGNPLPPGVTVDEGKSKTLIGTGNTGHIVLKVAPNAAPIENVPVCMLAHVSINFVVKISYASPVIPLTVRK